MSRKEDGKTAKLTCIVCSAQLDNIADDGEGMHPMGGIAFMTAGHYGTTQFDPMDGSTLEIAVCDPCIGKSREAEIISHRQFGRKSAIWPKKKEGGGS